MGYRKPKKWRNILKSSLKKGKEIKTETTKTSLDPLHARLERNIQEIKKKLGNSTDLVIREIYVGKVQNQKAAIIYMDGLADDEGIRDLMDSFLPFARNIAFTSETPSQQMVMDKVKDESISIGNVQDVHDFDTLFSTVLAGDAVIILDGCHQGISACTKGPEDRGITEPQTQQIVRGPREAFTETLRKNTALVRRKIKNPNLWIETHNIGTVTKTDVAVMFVEGIANDQVVEEVRSRLDRIEIDGILESAYIEEFIQDKTLTPFPTIYNTERPDIIAAGLLEGRVAILVDGTPFVLLVPALFNQFFQSNGDYYARSDFGSFLRILRLGSFFLALLLPAFYIALTTYRQEIIPTQLLISLAAQREGVPFPGFVEAMLMEVLFEILREAGLRMPPAVGESASIVGSFVIGIAAVQAGLISAAMVIIVSVTAIANFSLPSYNMAISIRILRFLFMFLAGFIGLFGIFTGLIAMILHLASLRSFGVPYLAPMAPFTARDQKDTIFRMPWGMMRFRPSPISKKNLKREDSSQSKSKPLEGQ